MRCCHMSRGYAGMQEFTVMKEEYQKPRLAESNVTNSLLILCWKYAWRVGGCKRQDEIESRGLCSMSPVSSAMAVRCCVIASITDGRLCLRPRIGCAVVLRGFLSSYRLTKAGRVGCNGEIGASFLNTLLF